MFSKLLSWLRPCKQHGSQPRSRSARQRPGNQVRLEVESLEDRLVPSWAGVPPATIAPPTAPTTVSLNGLTDVSGLLSTGRSSSIQNGQVNYYSLVAPVSGNYTLATWAIPGATPVNTVLGVFSSTGQLLPSSDEASPSNHYSQAMISLNGGQHVYFGITNATGAANGSYDWSVDGPLSNTSMANAYNLTPAPTTPAPSRGPTAPVAPPPPALTHVVMGGQDWLKFNLNGTGSVGSWVTVNFTSAQGQLDLDVYNAAGALLRSATGGINDESISLQGLTQGLYYVEIFGDQGASNPRFTLNDSFDVLTGDWFDTHIVTPALHAAAHADFAKGYLSRSDMIGLFNLVENAGPVTSTEMADLQTLVANGVTLDMSASVIDLANKVVNGNAANALFAGSPLGDLTAGSSSTQLRLLVDKWFLGLDLPLAQNDSQTITYTYQVAGGALFGSGGPVYQDVQQGDVGDCYFLAGLAECADRNPALIENMFTANGDGTYTVRFFNNGLADYVTVNMDLPVDSSGRFVFDGEGNNASNTSNVLWVALAEKAYAQVAEEGWSRPEAVNSYQSLSAGLGGLAMQEITGSPAVIENPLTFSGLVNAYNAGQLLVLGSPASATNQVIDANGVVEDHCYAVVGYNAATQTFTLFNPWGTNNGEAPGLLTLSYSKITASFAYWDDVALSTQAAAAAKPASGVEGAAPGGTPACNLSAALCLDVEISNYWEQDRPVTFCRDPHITLRLT